MVNDSVPEQPRDAFRSSATGSFLEREGPAREQEHSHKKLCFTATDREYLLGLLLELSRRPECVYVKCSVSPREGMYLGRCFVSTDEDAGRLWRSFHGHPRVMCTVQDDEFLSEYRHRGP